MCKGVKGSSWLSRPRCIAFVCMVYHSSITRYVMLKENGQVEPRKVVSSIKTNVYKFLFFKFPEFEQRFAPHDMVFVEY